MWTPKSPERGRTCGSSGVVGCGLTCVVYSSPRQVGYLVYKMLATDFKSQLAHGMVCSFFFPGEFTRDLLSPVSWFIDSHVMMRGCTKIILGLNPFTQTC